METDETAATVTSEADAVETPTTQASEPPNSVFPQPDSDNRQSPFDLRKRGAKRGNQNGASQGGAWALNRKRQRGFPTDHRTREGKAEIEITRLLVQEYGGEDRVTTRQRILIALASTNFGQLLEQKRSRRFLFQKIREAAKKRGADPRTAMRLAPKQLAELDSYMSPVMTALRNALTALGPEPERQAERLEDILTKIANEGEEQPDGRMEGE